MALISTEYWNEMSTERDPGTGWFTPIRGSYRQKGPALTLYGWESLARFALERVRHNPKAKIVRLADGRRVVRFDNGTQYGIHSYTQIEEAL